MPLTVENMFTDSSFELKKRIDGTALGALDRERMLTHVIADVTHQILSQPGANPVGLTITVNLVGPGPFTRENGIPDVVVMATCPQYELDPEFFTD